MDVLKVNEKERTMNKMICMGRLTNDPEIRYGGGDNSMAIARYVIAVDRIGRKKEGEQSADFIPCVAFDKVAEFAEKYFRKGMKVLVSGHIQTGSYINREGQKVYTTDLVIESQEFAESKKSDGNFEKPDEFMNIPDDIEDKGLPF